MTALADLGLPSTRAEDWRWARLDPIAAALAAAPANDAAPDAAHWLIPGVAGPVLVFIDGKLDARQSRYEGLSTGPVALSADTPLARLVGANAQDGWTLDIGADHASHGTIQIIHLSTGGPAHLGARIVLAEDAQASIVETYASVGDLPGWTNAATQIALAPSARLMRAVRQVAASGMVTLSTQVTIAHGASYDATLLSLGALSLRAEHHVTLGGEGAFASVDGVLLGRGEQSHDIVNVVRHAAPGGTSRQTWRSVVDGQATASTATRVEVARDAQQTDAEQSVKALLLARTATANAKPELEIFADDVKCAHGATVGELDRTALFYLASRGLPPTQARALLTEAFVADALMTIGEEGAREAFAADARGWLEQG